MIARSLVARFLRRVALSGTFFASVAGAGIAVAADCGEVNEEALSWLDRMSRSTHEVSYHGVVTLHRGTRMQSMQVSHVVEDGRAEESLTQLSGQAAKVTRVDHPLQCVHPGHRLLRLGGTLSDGECGVANNYSFFVGSGERIAGRTSVLIQVKPRDVYRFGYVLSLDKSTGLLLRTDTVRFDGKVLERFQFVKLSYDGPLPGQPEIETWHRAQHPMPGDGAAGARLERPWAVTWLPPGFTTTDSPSVTDDRRSYTDGLAVFSVFMERLHTSIQPGEGIVRNGGTLSYSRGMMLGGEPVLVTVVGEVPVNTARMVADKVAWMQ